MLREVARRASSKSCLVYPKLSPSHEGRIKISAPPGPPLYRGDHAYVQLLIIAVLPCSILLLRCILALIRVPFHPELRHRRGLQGRKSS